MSDTPPTPPPTHNHHTEQTELEKLLRRSQPWFAENATTLIYALAAVLALAAVWIYMNRSSAGNVEASSELLLASTSEEFRDVADNYPETDIGVLARIRQADLMLSNAVEHLFQDRETGTEELDDAEAAYMRLADRGDLEESFRERVLIGLARVAECRNDGTEKAASEATAAWQRVLDEFEDSIVADYAEKRVQQLSTEGSRTFYAWFHEQNPKPAPPGSTPGIPNIPGMEGIDMEALRAQFEAQSKEAVAPDLEGKPEDASNDESKEASEDSPDEAKAEDKKPAEPKKEEAAADSKTEDNETEAVKADKKPEAKADAKPADEKKPEPKKPDAKEANAADESSEAEASKE